MTKALMTGVLGVSALVLALAPGVQAQETEDSARTVESVFPGPAIPTNPLVDVVFTPITPCRIINTNLGGGPIAAGTTRNFVVAGTSGFPTQGGTAGGCGIPFGIASAAVINYIAVNPAGAGDLRVTPFGTPMPFASIVNYAAIPGLNIANGVATKLCSPIPSCATADITIQADASATSLVADVMGYYSSPGCQAGTVKALGQCYETVLRAADDIFAASDTCRAATGGGRLATTMELRSLRGGNPLTLDATGEWVDSFSNISAAQALIVRETGGITEVGTTSTHPYRCVFRALP